MIRDPAPFLSLFEHSPWVVEQAFLRAPFGDAAALHGALMQVVGEADGAAQLRLIRAHPELAVRAAPLTEASAAEQRGAGLKSLSVEEFERFSALNAAYRDKFGFPFIICVRMHDKAGILAAFARRLEHNAATERAQALREIGHIAWLRLQDILVAAP